ncbi:hypothetical protein QQF64_018548 [Cirrhinus molitorella]|uniref:Uncharacterized protein n=1 Tax=Cirrhinus molitorella TaxID=172907 RepID=A0ABR3LGF1_9TELE
MRPLYDPVSLLRCCSISGKGRNLQLTKSRDQNDPDYKRTICRENSGRIAVLVSHLVVHQCMCDLHINQRFFFFHRREDGGVACAMLLTDTSTRIHMGINTPFLLYHISKAQYWFISDSVFRQKTSGATEREMLLSHRLGEA